MASATCRPGDWESCWCRASRGQPESGRRRGWLRELRRAGAHGAGRGARGGSACGMRRFCVSPATLVPSSVGFERNVLRGGRKNPAADGQHLAADAYGLGKISGDMGERGEKQISEAVARERLPAAHREAVLKQPPEQVLVLRKRHHAVANVAGRENAVFAAQAAGAAAIVGDSDDCRKIGDGAAEQDRAGCERRNASGHGERWKDPCRRRSRRCGRDARGGWSASRGQALDVVGVAVSRETSYWI